MELTLSVYFGNDRTYLTLVKPKEDGLELVYLNATSSHIDLDNIENSQSGVLELNKILDDINHDIGQLTVTLPSENVLVTKFPSKPNITLDELKKLVNLEIRQNFPQYNHDDFTSTTIKFAPKLDGVSMDIAVIIPKQNYISCKKILEKIKVPISNTEISQFNAHNAFLFNYPDYTDKTVVLIGIYSQFIDFSVMTDTKPLYYNLLNFKEENEFGKILENEINKLLNEYVNFIDAVYFFGSNLNKELYTTAKEGLKGIVMETGKFNAFRMLSTHLDIRDKEYSSRTAHIYPPCIGACIKPYHERLKIV